MSSFWSIVFITLELLLTSLVEGPPFEDECDDSSFDAAFYNRSTLFILKNPYVYTWKRDSIMKEGFSGKLKSKQHRYRFWPQIDDQITAACSDYDEDSNIQLYVFMNDQMMYFYADHFNEETQFWESYFWEHSFEEIPNHEYFVPTCMFCYMNDYENEDKHLIKVTTQFANSDLTEFRECKSKANYKYDSLMDKEPSLSCESKSAAKSRLVEILDEHLNKTQSCLHYVESLGDEPGLIFTGDKMVVIREEAKPLNLPVDETLFGCVEPPSFLSEVVIGLILWFIAVLTTVLPLLYFILTNPIGDESRSHSKGKGQDDQEEVKESMEEKDERFIVEALSPLRQRIHLQRFRQPFAEEDTIRTIISTG